MPEKQLNDQLLFCIWTLAGFCVLSVIGTICVLIFNVVDASELGRQIKLPASLESAGDVVLGYFLVQSRAVLNIKENSKIIPTARSAIKWDFVLAVTIVFASIGMAIYSVIKSGSAYFPPIFTTWFCTFIGFICACAFEIIFTILKEKNDWLIDWLIRIWVTSGIFALGITGFASWLLFFKDKEDIAIGSPLINTWELAEPIEMLGSMALSYFLTQFRAILRVLQSYNLYYLSSFSIYLGIVLAALLIAGLLVGFSGVIIHAGAIKASSLELPSFFQAWVFSMLGFAFGSAGETMMGGSTNEEISKKNR